MSYCTVVGPCFVRKDSVRPKKLPDSDAEEKTKQKYWTGDIEHTIICVDWIEHAHSV